MEQNGGYNLLEVLDAIDPTQLDYHEWLSVGMALKEEGYTASCWDDWSQRDSARYKSGESWKKWDTFRGEGSSVVTGGTLVELARRQGWSPSQAEDIELDYDSVITVDDEPLFLADFSKGDNIKLEKLKTSEFDPVTEITTYLQALFDGDEYVNIVVASYERDGKYLPAAKGLYNKTSGELIEALLRCNGDIGNVIGDYNKQAGAWIRINPLDGHGVNNANVTEFRYCLIESDNIPVDDQNIIIRKLELPVAALVHSGGKSLHAIVHVDATDRKQYDERVRIIVDTCNANGLDVDMSNKNPARLSRLPGIMRGKQRQYIIDSHIGRADFADWLAWRNESIDGLPDATDLFDDLSTPFDADDILIEGILSGQEKMLFAAQAKIGKTFALMELCVAFATGGKWLGKQCAKTNVLYINFELKAKSRKNRLKRILDRSKIQASAIRGSIFCLDLRGKSVTLDKLTNTLVKHVTKNKCKVIIIDPIYKVIKGDESSSEDVSKFCNELDYMMERLGVAIVYCHHYSKAAGNYASSMNRASGSSVFSRDADALITMDALAITEDMHDSRFNTVGCHLCESYLTKYGPVDWRERLREQDDIVVLKQLRASCRELLPTDRMNALIGELDDLESSLTACRIEGTLRDFPPLIGINVWYENPLHTVDELEVLKDAETVDEAAKTSWRKSKKKETRNDRKAAVKRAIETLFDGINPLKLSDVADYVNCSDKTVRAYINGSGYDIARGFVVKKETEK
jgi:RecA-family ATPase